MAKTRRRVAEIDLSGLPLVPYARISRDSKGRETGVKRQNRVMRLASKDQEVPLLETTFYENDASAAPDAPERPVWNETFELLASGEVGGLAIFEVERAARDGWIGESLIRLVRQKGFKKFIVWCPEESYDLSKQKGVSDFRAAIDRAEREVYKIRYRTTATLHEKAEMGELIGGSPRRFGWTDAYTNTHHPEEVRAMRDAARWLLDDTPRRTVRACIDAWTERGIRTVKTTFKTGKRKGQTRGGLEFSHARFRDVMLRPLNAGIITADDGEEMGLLPGEPIFDRATYDRLVALFTSRKRGRPAEASEKTLMGGLELLYCPDCKSRMSQFGDKPWQVRNAMREAKKNGTPLPDWVEAGEWERVWSYRCQYKTDGYQRRGCLQAARSTQVDAVITEQVIAWWADPKRGARDAEVLASMSKERKELHARLTQVDAAIDALNEKMLNGSLPVERFTAALDTFTAEREPLAQRLNELGGDGRTPHVVVTPARAVAMWKAASHAERQTMTKAAINRVEIHKASKQGNEFDTRRVNVILN